MTQDNLVQNTKLTTKLRLMPLLVVTLFSSPVFAGVDCQISNAHIVSIMPLDGVTFINVDGANNCGCSIPTRFGILTSDPNAKTFIAEALTAFATNSKVTIYANAGCSVHGNTASVYTFVLGGGS